MSFFCTKCGHENLERDNVFGTICSNCKAFIPPETKPKFIREMEEKRIFNQNIIRQKLKKKMLGDQDGNKIEQKN